MNKLDNGGDFQKKKYFLKDESLLSVDDDAFRHIDISKLIRTIINTNEPPFNIGMIGKWGLGKSSLINMAIEQYKKQPDKYIVQEINAWKYEKEALGKVFLKQLWQGISNKKVKTFEVIKREFSEIIKCDLDNERPKDIKKLKQMIFTTSGFIIGASIISFIIYKFVQAYILNTPIWNWIFWGKMLLSYCKNVVTVLLFPVIIGLISVLISEIYNKDTKKIELSFPIETTDDYEIFLEEKIEEKLSENPNLRVITIIDDLDRLSIDKIVEALDALKAFVGFKRCIFIVPFDDAILKNALNKRRISAIDSSHEIIESELILDKLFQYKIYLPPMLEFDIREYACKLVKEKVTDFINEYCNYECLEKIIKKILIHSNVSTPRQVKKLINTFVNNLMIASNRENANKIERGFLTSELGMYQIAKLSVLQADFNEFYDLLFKDFNYLDGLLRYHRNHEAIGDIPIDLRSFFVDFEERIDEDTKLKSKVKEEYEPLVNFLSKTEKYKVPNIAPFLYLAQDEISRKTGDENQRRLLSAVESNNNETVKEMLGKSPNLAEALNYQISVSDYDNLLDLIITTVNTFDVVNDMYKTELATTITEKFVEIVEINKEFVFTRLSIDNLLLIFEFSNNKEYSTILIENYLDELLNFIGIETNIICTSIRSLLAKDIILTDKISDMLKSVIKSALANKDIEVVDFLNYVDIKDIKVFDEYLGIAIFNKLCNTIDEKNNFDKTILDAFKIAFLRLSNTIDTNIFIEQIISLFKYHAIIDELDEMFTKEICDKTSTQNATMIAENIITLDLEQDSKKIFSMLSKLSYEVNKGNCESFDDFISNFESYAPMDDILSYCGSQGYFKYLEKSINLLTDSVFVNEENDNTLTISERYYTKEQKEYLFNNLNTKCIYSNGMNYTRLPIIYEILSRNPKNKDLLKQSITVHLLPSFYGYYTQTPYFTMVSDIIGYTKDYLDKETLDKYINHITNVYNSHIDNSLKAMRSLGKNITNENMQNIWPKLKNNITKTTYQLIYDIAIDNSKYFDKERGNLSELVNFLVDNLELSSSPNLVIDTLHSKFTYISRNKDLIIKINKLDGVDKDKSSFVIAKFFDNWNDVEKVIDIIISVLFDENYEFMTQVFKKIKNYTITDIFDGIINAIDDAIDQRILVNLLKFCKDNRRELGVEISLRILEQLLEDCDEPKLIDEVLNVIREFGPDYYKDSKKIFAEVLYNCFNKSTSNEIRTKIVKMVGDFKLVRQFKPLLDEDEKDFYVKGIS
jgi:hypothetical protein